MDPGQGGAWWTESIRGTTLTHTLTDFQALVGSFTLVVESEGRLAPYGEVPVTEVKQ
jgi:hypothetical protein